MAIFDIISMDMARIMNQKQNWMMAVSTYCTMKTKLMVNIILQLVCHHVHEYNKEEAKRKTLCV